MRVRVFYHICALNHWESVVRDQLAKLVFSGLYDAAVAVHCFCTGPEAMRAAALVQTFGAKFIVERCDAEDRSGERFTLMRMPALLDQDTAHTDTETACLYIHTKGVTKIPPSAPVFYWQWYMDYFLIKNFKTCLAMLETHDVVGVDFYPASGPHFSGNFWWARADWIRALPLYDGPEDADKYTGTETWVCSGTSPRLCQLAHSRTNLYTTALPPAPYVDAHIS